MDGFKITQPGDVIDKLFVYRDKYHEKGKYLGFKNLHEHYSMSLGNCTDWSGFPMSGKTQFLMECLVNTSKFYGWKHLVYFPDVGSNVEIIADLIHKVTGKTFDPDKRNAIKDSEITRSIDWITQHFKVLTKRDVKAKMTPFQFWDYAVDLKKREGLETASIDSWKDMHHDYAKYGQYAQYLEIVLPYRNMIAENNDLHLNTIIHPKLTEKENGVRKAPTPFDLKGGSEWINSGKCQITIHREDIMNNSVDVYFNKIKPRSNGNVGRIQMHFDIERFVYYDEVGIHQTKEYAKKL
tara:strand:- start:665 stop:1549 length:885 start_codon:yes stop_codon:yes gene_type:complete